MLEMMRCRLKACPGVESSGQCVLTLRGEQLRLQVQITGLMGPVEVYLLPKGAPPVLAQAAPSMGEFCCDRGIAWFSALPEGMIVTCGSRPCLYAAPAGSDILARIAQITRKADPPALSTLLQSDLSPSHGKTPSAPDISIVPDTCVSAPVLPAVPDPPAACTTDSTPPDASPSTASAPSEARPSPAQGDPPSESMSATPDTPPSPAPCDTLPEDNTDQAPSHPCIPNPCDAPSTPAPDADSAANPSDASGSLPPDAPAASAVTPCTPDDAALSPATDPIPPDQPCPADPPYRLRSAQPLVFTNPTPPAQAIATPCSEDPPTTDSRPCPLEPLSTDQGEVPLPWALDEASIQAHLARGQTDSPFPGVLEGAIFTRVPMDAALGADHYLIGRIPIDAESAYTLIGIPAAPEGVPRGIAPGFDHYLPTLSGGGYWVRYLA